MQAGAENYFRPKGAESYKSNSGNESETFFVDLQTHILA